MSVDHQTTPRPAPVVPPATLHLPPATGRAAADLAAGAAVAWEEPVTIRTYETGAPTPHPVFLDRRVYQGSSGRVYPLPFVEHVADDAVDRPWRAVHLENRYVRLVVLPDLGGRIHVGYDKTTGYDFFYRNTVVKPALVGLAGPWVSGGVEFNWPQHHRPGTYLPVETSIEHGGSGGEGSVTVWCGDHDPFTRMAGTHGIRLRPESSVVELVVRLHNRTPDRQSFLWWANVAARVHDEYQSFFPEDVRHVADHAGRAVTAFPRADRPYYGVDYPARGRAEPDADRIDFYRNIPVPTSYMVVGSRGEFFGGYDHRAGAGFVHWAERRVSPGKKQWTWGNSAFGHAWDRHLTDGDGPYVELMAGVFTDNQPDFSWLLPGETKTFRQCWFPLPDTGVVHEATPDAVVHVAREPRDGGAEHVTAARFAVSSPRLGALARARRGADVLRSATLDLVPGRTATFTVGHPVTADLAVELLDAAGRVLVRWNPADVTAVPEPAVAEPPAAPSQVGSVEELHLVGVHLEQYRHPTRSPVPYWREALRRDPGHAGANLALAERELRRGRYAAALAHVDTATARLTRHNANPRDAEAFYLRGLVLARLGRIEEAETAFGKAMWDGQWVAPAGLELARSLARRGRDRAAVRVLDDLDGVAAADARRTALRVVLMRRVGRDRTDAEAEATTLLREALTRDPLDVTLRVLAGQGLTDPGLLLDVAADLRSAGESAQALHLLERAVLAAPAPAGNVRPMALYVAALVQEERGEIAAAADLRRRARQTDATGAFPYGLDAHDALAAAVVSEPGDAVATHLLGTLLYVHGRRAEAAARWEEAVALGSPSPVLLRNAGLAAYNVLGDDDLAWRRYEAAVAADPADGRLRLEHDQLSARLGASARDRLGRLQAVEDVVLARDDLTLVLVGLLVETGRPEDARRILLGREFHPWEGGEGRALAAWDAVARALGEEPSDPPPSLGEARPPVTSLRPPAEDDYFATSLPDPGVFHREPLVANGWRDGRSG